MSYLNRLKNEHPAVEAEISYQSRLPKYGRNYHPRVRPSLDGIASIQYSIKIATKDAIPNLDPKSLSTSLEENINFSPSTALLASYQGNCV